MPAAARCPCHPSAVGAWGWGGLDGHESPLSAWWGDPVPTARATDVTAVPVGPRGRSASSKANWTQPRGAPGMAGTRGAGDGRPARGALRMAGTGSAGDGWPARRAPEMAGWHWEHHRELGAGGPGSPSSRDRSEGVWLEPGPEPPSAAGLISPGQEERAGPALPVEQVSLLRSLLLCTASCPPRCLGGARAPTEGGPAAACGTIAALPTVAPLSPGCCRHSRSPGAGLGDFFLFLLRINKKNSSKPPIQGWP